MPYQGALLAPEQSKDAGVGWGDGDQSGDYLLALSSGPSWRLQSLGCFARMTATPLSPLDSGSKSVTLSS